MNLAIRTDNVKDGGGTEVKATVSLFAPGECLRVGIAVGSGGDVNALSLSDCTLGLVL